MTTESLPGIEFSRRIVKIHVRSLSNVLPEQATNKEVEWASLDSAVATVDQNGRVKAKKKGETIITVTSKENPLISASCQVKVMNKLIPTKKIMVKQADIQLNTKDTYQLEVVRTPASTTDELIYTSENSEIAVISAKGVITAIRAGKTQISITSGSITQKVQVTVLDQVKEPTVEDEVSVIPQVYFNVKSVPLKVKESTNAVKAQGLVSNDKIIGYKSSRKSVATVSKTGKITAKKTGKAIITVTTEMGATANCEVKVVKNTVKLKKITVEQKNITLEKGKSCHVAITKNPITAKDKLKFKSSNKKIATVNSSGKVVGKKSGKARITIYTDNGIKTTVTIQVK